MTKVAIVKCRNYEQTIVDSSILEAVNHLGGIKKFVRKGDKVLLKPNLLMGAAPEKTVTTNPAILKAAIKLVKDAGGIPFVGDSPGFGNPLAAMKKAGLYDVCEETKTKVVEFKGKKTKNPKGKVAKSFMLHEDLFKFDCIIGLPKLKTHSFTDYTGAVKNFFGLVVGMEKGKYHIRFQDKVLFYEMLLDLYLFTKPRLCIMDAVVSMEGDGPAGGQARHTGLVMASSDAIALDYAAMQIIDMNKSALHAACEKRALVPKLDIVGENIQKLIIKDFKKSASYTSSSKRRLPKWAGELIEKTFKKAFVLDPVVNKADCTGCKTCNIVCPSEPKTIKMLKGNAQKSKIFGTLKIKGFHRKESEKKNPQDIYPRFDYDKCIRCYCCQESCPEKAIVLKRRLI